MATFREHKRRAWDAAWKVLDQGVPDGENPEVMIVEEE